MVDAVKCRICGGHASGDALSELNLNLVFKKNEWLPERINLFLCRGCDYIFCGFDSSADYSRYYRSITNDNYVDEIPANSKYRNQCAILEGSRDMSAANTLLDVGCGEGGLLKRVKSKYPHINCIGMDPSAQCGNDNGVEYVNTMQELSQFGLADIIVMSHTLEHLTSFESIAGIADYLKDEGLLYIEVPDASNYWRFPRREFLYYIDRLHINHFSIKSILQIFERSPMAFHSSGTAHFPYKDGLLYPAFYILLKKSSNCAELGKLTIERQVKTVEHSFKDYVNVEAQKATALKVALGSEGVVVWGFGDNFFRNVSSFGPLGDIDIVAVADFNAEILRKTHYSTRYQFLSINEAVTRYSDKLFVVCMSWNVDLRVKELRKLGVRDIIVV